MVRVMHYESTSGSIQVVEEWPSDHIGIFDAYQTLFNMRDGDHGTDSFWYIDTDHEGPARLH